MSSSGRSDPLDLDRDLKTTAEDVTALDRMRRRPLSTPEYLAFLRALPPLSTEQLRRRPGPSGAPFEF